ncbi:unnamed protein product, partial [Staurois parvus]
NCRLSAVLSSHCDSLRKVQPITGNCIYQLCAVLLDTADHCREPAVVRAGIGTDHQGTDDQCPDDRCPAVPPTSSTHLCPAVHPPVPSSATQQCHLPVPSSATCAHPPVPTHLCPPTCAHQCHPPVPT